MQPRSVELRSISGAPGGGAVVGGEEGAFTLCGFWLAEVLAMMGRLEEAQAVFTAHAEASNHVGLLAEEIDPVSRTQLGNFPQAFSHVALINTARNLANAHGPARERAGGHRITDH